MSGNGPATWVQAPSTGRVNGTGAPPIGVDIWQWRDPRLMQPRPWLLGTVLMRGHTTLLGSPGGTGKTAWAVAAAMAVITGRRDILGLHSFVQGTVWFITLEDDKVELERRIAAAMLEHHISPADVTGKLLISDGRMKLVEPSGDRRAPAQPTDAVEDCKEIIKQNNVVLCIIDPLVKAHSVGGNSNEDMDVLLTVSNEIARETGCSMLLPCHFKKGGNLDDDGRDMFRGASSVVDAARIALGMQAMTDQEAERFGIEEKDAGRFVRMVNAKANMSPKALSTDWCELVSQELGNTQVDPTYPAGDSVQAVRRWQSPKMMDGMDYPVMHAVFARLGDASQIFHPGSGTNQNWAGDVLIALAGKSHDQASGIIKAWLKSGTLVKTTYQNASRKDRVRLVLDPGKAAEILANLAVAPSAP